MAKSLSLDLNVPKEDTDELEEGLNMGCSHYRRNCQLIAPCCKKKYICRICHDEVENHQLNRHSVERIECLVCKTEQPVSQHCISENCKIRFGLYYCSICRLFDNKENSQYHCDGCGLCRVGGRENFFHCDRCKMCLPKSMTKHKCIDDISHRDCPICLEYIHTSRIVSHMPPCGHLIHTPCYIDLLNAGIYACPTCGKSMVHMNSIWKKMDEEIEKVPMPSEFSDMYCNILCKDCQQEGLTRYHSLGLKCTKCGSYNTARGSGSLLRMTSEK
ncbi:UNVERIFIED_CONTAM: hypothetical protein RMT77_004745 [Armadillidium vulgare]